MTTETARQTVPAEDNGTIVRATEDDYPALAALWEASVRATHAFLAEDDLLRIRAALATEYLPAVACYIRRAAGCPVAFAGIADGKLEMLFVHPDWFGNGFGSELLDFAVREKGVTQVDVNEENVRAERSYRTHGFRTGSRDETDSEGLPYPILHMTLRQ